MKEVIELESDVKNKLDIDINLRNLNLMDQIEKQHLRTEAALKVALKQRHLREHFLILENLQQRNSDKAAFIKLLEDKKFNFQDEADKFQQALENESADKVAQLDEKAFDRSSQGMSKEQALLLTQKQLKGRGSADEIYASTASLTNATVSDTSKVLSQIKDMKTALLSATLGKQEAKSVLQSQLSIKKTMRRQSVVSSGVQPKGTMRVPNNLGLPMRMGSKRVGMSAIQEEKEPSVDSISLSEW